MSVFAYEALDAKGKKSKGVIEADSPRQVRQKLRISGLNAIAVSAATGQETSDTTQNKRSSSGSLFRSLYQRKATDAEVALLTRQLATLVAAGIPLEECLQALVRQLRKPHLKSIVTTVRSKILEGQSLADSLACYPKTFDRLYRSMVAAGEKSGHLDGVLERLADFTEHRQKIKGQLIQAMIYPAILTLVAICVVAALLVTVVPTVVEQFAHMGQQLPTMTLTLISISDFVRAYGPGIAMALLVTLVIRQQILQRSRTCRLVHDRWLLKLPLIGSVLSGVDGARFARTLSILTSSTVPLLEGMGIAAKVLVNQHMQASLLNAAERVREGSSLWQSLEQTELFSPMMLYIIASGEKSGELTGMLARAADNQDQQFESQVNIALGIFGPLLIVTMAGVVLFIVMAILTPMLDLNSLVGG
ncbi:type II secretion system inner membrane protein GspF [Salinisphaera sp. G21_0]|uniref:type II secretion system inner membrane protein GspF n=1 Tax=Salinisphaera sp. G21_0 TaxID=2821094 RepID=UPI001ADC6D19|nr:type II secretion system inner membrane protein GspF [Salinisphaera sp. G21_0]MBO9482801.1 type II secretion system inner membrane protein GspF [Salinisphaera sp. G21_0]